MILNRHWLHVVAVIICLSDFKAVLISKMYIVFVLERSRLVPSKRFRIVKCVYQQCMSVSEVCSKAVFLTMCAWWCFSKKCVCVDKADPALPPNKLSIQKPWLHSLCHQRKKLLLFTTEKTDCNVKHWITVKAWRCSFFGTWCGTCGVCLISFEKLKCNKYDCLTNFNTIVLKSAKCSKLQLYVASMRWEKLPRDVNKLLKTWIYTQLLSFAVFNYGTNGVDFFAHMHIFNLQSSTCEELFLQWKSMIELLHE